MKAKRRKAETIWGVRHADGGLFAFTMRTERAEALATWREKGNTPWRYWHLRGYRVVKLSVHDAPTRRTKR